MQKIEEIDELIAAAEQELSELDARRTTLQEKITGLKQQKTSLAEQQSPYIFQQNQSPTVTSQPCEKEKTERGTLVLYQLNKLFTSDSSSPAASRFTADVVIPKKRATSAPE